MGLSKQLKFTFRGKSIQRPLIYEVGHKFNVTTNIRKADVESDGGWVILELTGSKEEINQALDWLKEEGVRVDNVAGDIVAG